MADEVDPLQGIIETHVKRMQDITNEGLAKTQSLCEQSLNSIKLNTGRRNAVLDRALESLGITTEKVDA